MAVNTVEPLEVHQFILSGQSPVIIDVRTPAEYAGVHIVGARLMPLDGFNPAAVAGLRPTASDPIYVTCQSGARAGKACERLTQAGVAPVYSIEGGTAAWERLGLPVERGG